MIYLLCFASVIAVFKLFGGIILPFVIAFVLAYAVRKIADKVKLVTGLSTKAGGFLCLLSVYLVVTVSLFFALRFIINEIGDFFTEFPALYESLIKPKLQQIAVFFSENLSGEMKDLPVKLIDTLGDFVAQISGKLTSWVAGIVLKIPEIIFSVFVTVLASFFICFDYNRIKNFIIRQFPNKIKKNIYTIKNVITNSALKMLGCYFFMFLITFGELFVGLTLLGIEHSFFISFIIAVADALPMIGVGAVLIPWGIISLINSNIYLASGLFALFFIIIIVHNIVEPKIIGKKMGIHPLLSLAAVYIGIKCGGILTAAALLFLLVTVKYLNQSGTITLYK